MIISVQPITLPMKLIAGMPPDVLQVSGICTLGGLCVLGVVLWFSRRGR